MDLRLVSLSEAQVGSWVYQVGQKEPRLSFVACWETERNKLVIEINEFGAMIHSEIGMLLPIGNVEVVPAWPAIRTLSRPKPGAILVTHKGAYLSALTEKGQTINVDLRSGVAPQDTTDSVAVPTWSLVSRSYGGAERVLFSMKG